jgi:hypothetical protein
MKPHQLKQYAELNSELEELLRRTFADFMVKHLDVFFSEFDLRDSFAMLLGAFVTILTKWGKTVDKPPSTVLQDFMLEIETIIKRQLFVSNFGAFDGKGNITGIEI